MLAIEVEYLTGCAVATDREVRNRVEWPPHPQRLFSALVSAYAECGGEESERAALEWLEGLGPPQLACPAEVWPRDVLPVYVPVNDESTPDRAPKDIGNALKALPSNRTRQERFFPTLVVGGSFDAAERPMPALVHFQWPDADAADVAAHRSALESIAAGVGYLGHSMSVVRVAVVENSIPATLEPALGAAAWSTEQLRTVGPGRLDLLERVHQQSLSGNRRIEAPDVPYTGYRPVGSDVVDMPESVFGDTRDWLVFQRTKGRRLPLEACLALTTSVRRAVASICDDSLAGLLCGHEPGGKPVETPHVAYLPLAHVESTYADGEIHGFAVVLPRGLPWAIRRGLLAGIAPLQEVWNNETAARNKHLAFDWNVEQVTGEERKWSLQPAKYLSKSRCWSTVTPVVFGHFLRPGNEARTRRIIAESCQAIGLPAPVHIEVSPSSRLRGVPLATAFPSLSTQGKPVWTSFRDGRHHVPRKLGKGAGVRQRHHVTIQFDQPVKGPVILGAGRYFGMGLCHPTRDVFLEDGSEHGPQTEVEDA